MCSCGRVVDIVRWVPPMLHTFYPFTALCDLKIPGSINILIADDELNFLKRTKILNITIVLSKYFLLRTIKEFPLRSVWIFDIFYEIAQANEHQLLSIPKAP